MIHVQIASQVTLDGVSGVRWVLLDDAEPPQAPPAAEPLPIGTFRQTPLAAGGLRGAFTLLAMKALLLVLGLGAALWVAQGRFGPPTARWWPATTVAQPGDAVRPSRAVPPPQRALPPAAPPAPPMLPSSSPGPWITARLP